MENQQLQNESNLGETLRQYREKLGLSIEDVANKTLLKQAVIKHIENNEFIVAACPPTFMKGYVRSYAKFLKVPESVWNNPAISYGEPIRNDLQKNMRTNNRVNHYSSYSGWIGRLTWLIALIMISMTAYWWWQNYQQSQSERTNLVESFLNSTQSENTEQAVQVASTGDNGGQHGEAVTADTTIDSPLANLPTTGEENGVLTPPAEVSTAANDSVASYQGQTSGQVLSDVMEQLDGSPNTLNPSDNSEQSAVGDSGAAIVGDGLTIEIVGNSCWLSVRDANRKILAQKEYKQGEILTFSDGEPYSLVIGAPQNVRITFRGQEVPLTIDGRVARIKLPE
ncbi:hypothetical protein OA57_07525 [Chelonobacter oris]|uniref:HTH cro/C1-type domain-containing protein n=1 Tax=Chelonobacter oris TaxID=505317 RepID=A0A0A3ALD8_9PAST|nr:RodZ domain-containing protein [Chelonobacter oris]KGQ70173.1 hypothetical protein OA57_07525 [Chelonobacter oris]